MKEVFRIVPDTDRFASLICDDNSVVKDFFDGTPHEGRWAPPEIVYWDDPMKEIPDICVCFGRPDILAYSARAYDLLTSRLLETGEMEALAIAADTMYVHNVTYALNCLDKAKTKFSKRDPDKILKYAFHERMDCSPFKLPETRRSELLCFEFSGWCREDHYKSRIEDLGLTGLTFERIWSKR